jgi:hypothetical protein
VDKTISLNVHGSIEKIEVSKAYCIGFAGRNQDKVMEHINELEEIGVPGPEEIPILYPVRVSSLTQGDSIEVLGGETGGEVEFVLIFDKSTDDAYVTVGSDHTDRKLESVDINKSKQVCDKPFAEKAWPLKDVIDHWDQLTLKSSVLINNEWVLYQEDAVDSILHPQDILDYLSSKNISQKNAIFFSGTVPLKEGFMYGDKFRMTLSDPVRKDEIYWEYEIRQLNR